MLPIHRTGIVLIVLAVLTACGAAPSATAPTAAPIAAAPTSAPAEPTASVPTSAPATSAAFPRTITHSKGQTTLEKPAVRVAALEWTYVEDLLAIGVQPIAVADIEGYNTWVKTPVALGAQAQDVGGRGEPNLEKLATAKPDLIIDTLENVSTNYDALVKIAPVLVFTPYSTDPSMNQYREMTETLLKIAAATGRDAEGQAALDQMDQTFAELAAKVAAAGKQNAPFILSQAWSDSGAASIRLFTETAMASQIVERLGLKTAWKDSQGFQQYGFSTVSMEALPQISADTNVFYVVQNSDNPFTMGAVKPLWDNLPFVKAGNAYALGGDTWLFGGPLSAQVLAGIVVDTLAAGSAAPAAASSVASAAFPVSIKHRLGTAVISAAPKRIVTLGESDVDTVIALGLMPIAIQGNTYTESGIAPWLTGKIDQASIEVFKGDVSIERIAALKPDLILATGMDSIDDVYAQVSQIAPTVIGKGSVEDSWQEQVQLIGHALGKDDQAKQLVADTEAQIAATSAAYPALAGKTFSLSYAYEPSAIATVWSPEDAAVKFFKQLGLAVTPELANLSDFAKNPSAILSFEQVTLLDADLLVLAYGPDLQTTYEANPLFQKIKAVQDGRYLAVDLVTVAEMRTPTVLGIPWVLEQLRPGLAKVK